MRENFDMFRTLSIKMSEDPDELFSRQLSRLKLYGIQIAALDGLECIGKGFLDKATIHLLM